ncbi:MAG: hypothetical protein VB108_02790 [Anaerolineaceae bacterium]|nr:hypothetical protein [Anaerolineaceae bacterium]
MQANQEVLYKLARDFVARKTRSSNDLVSVYLTGSILREDPLLGGTTDIDLVMVHKEPPAQDREVQRVSYEVSFDIQHHHQAFYSFHRRLRLNPWLGEALCSHNSVLYDTGHWFDFIQAGVSSQYMTPENIYRRAQAFAETARQEWFELDDPQEISFSSWVDLYFKAVYTAANAVAVIAGPALTTRRLLLDFPARAEALGQLPLVGDLNRLISADSGNEAVYKTWRPVWEGVLKAAAQHPHCPPNLSASRKAYFLAAADDMAQKGLAHASFWPMLETWRGAMHFLGDQETFEKDWHAFLAEIEFLPETKAHCSTQLDHFIDAGENALAEWKGRYGL